MGPFIAYFPTFLKFHELFRLGAYCHPFDLITEFYNTDRLAHTDYTINGDNWSESLGDLRIFAESPVAFLSPAMQEGSALAGPFLPIEWTLHELHHYVGLGSIWGIGLPDMPATVTNKDVCAHFGLYAFPQHWKVELAYALGHPLTPASAFTSVNPPPATSGRTTITLSQMPDDWLSISSNLNRTKLAEVLGGDMSIVPVSHIGAKIGATTVMANPGWTSHLPAESGLLCSTSAVHVISDFATIPSPIARFACDRSRVKEKLQASMDTKFLTSWDTTIAFGTPIFLSGQEVSTSVPWIQSTLLEKDPFEARVRCLNAPSQKRITSHDFEHSENPNDVKKGKLKDLEAKNKALQKQVKMLEGKIKSLGIQNKSLKEKIEARSEEAELPPALAELEKQVDDLQATCDERLAEITHLRAHQSRTEPINLHSGTEEAPSLSELNTRQLRERLEEATRERALSSTKIQTLERQVATLATRLSEARQSNTEAQNSSQTLISLKNQLSTLDETIAAKKSKIAQLDHQIEDREFHEYDSRLTQQVHHESQAAQAAYSHATSALKNSELENLDLLDRMRALEGDDYLPLPENFLENRPGNDGGISSQLMNITRTNLKRKVQEDLFHHGNKRMKSSDQVDVACLTDPSIEGITRYMSIAHNEVLRVAATGGLINPMHFDVTRGGTIALSRFGIERAALFGVYKSQPGLLKSWADKMSIEMSNMVRSLMDRGGFFQCGHPALRPLVYGLQNRKIMTVGDLINALQDMGAQTESSRQKLFRYIHDFRDKKAAVFTEEDKVELKSILHDLYAQHSDGQFGSTTTALLTDTRIGKPRERIFAHLQHINNSYHFLTKSTGDITRSSTIPGHYIVPIAPWTEVTGEVLNPDPEGSGFCLDD